MNSLVFALGETLIFNIYPTDIFRILFTVV